jgi:hypothetical protein
MDRVANRRLIEAAQALSSADRALLNIWIHHGLDDTALARLTQTSPGAIASRRDGIVTGLSSTLGLPPEHVRDAIEELAHSERVPAAENGSAPPAVRPSNAVSQQPPEPPGETGPALVTPPPSSASGRRDGERQRGRMTRVAAAALASIALLLVLIVLLSGGSDASRSAGPRPQRSSPAEVGHRQAFSELAGGPAGVTGSVAYFGAPPHVRLVMTVRGLPPPGGDRYELWLYNSIIDSVPLGQLSGETGQLTVALPSDYRRFRWLDISRQPAGAAHHSGVSILRTATGP